MEKRVDKMLPDDSTAPTHEYGSFRAFVEAVNPTLLEYRHVDETLIPVAERVATGDLDRVLVLMPPRYFKSEVFSRLLPAYKLHRTPSSHVGLTSYSAQLAWDLSDDARNYYREVGGETATSTDAKREWATSLGGEMWADGLGGSLTGKGFDLGVIDDPMKPQHARSTTYTKEFRKWYPEVFYNRAEPGASIVVVMQRLSSNDPIDYLYRREVGRRADKDAQNWHVVCLDEIHSSASLASYDGPKGLPPTCTLEQDDREEGEILAPNRFDREEVEKQQSAAGRARMPQRQQRKGQEEGALWSQNDIDRHRAGDYPDLERIVVAVDPAVTSSDSSDETGIIVVGKSYEGHAYILGDYSGTWTPTQWASKVVAAFRAYRADVVVGEVNNGGDLVESNLRGEYDPLSFQEVRATRGKTIRAEPVSKLYTQGKAHHVGAFEQLEHQMTTWQGGSSNDSPDRVDALVWALTELMLQDEGKPMTGKGMTATL